MILHTTPEAQVIYLQPPNGRDADRLWCADPGPFFDEEFGYGGAPAQYRLVYPAVFILDDPWEDDLWAAGQPCYWDGMEKEVMQ